MKKIYSVLLFILTFSSVWAQCPDLFFSEYIEGSSNNKAIEVYNPSDTTVDLSNYQILRFNNGAVTPSGTLQLTGTLASGAVWIAANPSANAAIQAEADTLSSICFYNGDDAMVLMNVTTGDTLDIIGIVGVDPGSSWTVGTGATSNFTLIRMASIQMGTTNWAQGATEWDVYPIDMTDSLGSHTGYICPGTPVSSVPYYSIGSVNTVDANGLADSIGAYVQLTGTVYGGDLRGGNGVQFFLRDFSGGIAVFSSSLNTYVVNETDSIRAFGSISQFNGLTQLSVDSIWNISTGATLETPDVVTSLSEITESDLVEFQCATLVNPAQWTGTGSGFNVDVTNGTDTILVRIDADVNLYSQPAPVGSFTVRGMGSQFDSSSPFDSGYQLLPRDSSDIIAANVTAAFAATPNGINIIDFTDVSTGATSWAWDFGDGNTSTQQNPTHTYAASGTYSVVLISTGPCGADTTTQSVTTSSIPTYPIGVVNTVDANGVADSSGTYCRITGTVYGVDLRGGNGVQFFMRDNSGGIALFSSSLNTYVVNQTDSIEAYGTVGQFNGLLQLGVDSINIISTGATLETPDVVTSLSEITESDLVEFQCATLVNPAQWTGSGSGFNVDVTNGTDTILVRIDADVNLYSQPAPTGTFTVRGMGGQFDNSNPFDSGYQLLPRDTNDIVNVSVTSSFTWASGGFNVINFTNTSAGATSYAWDFGDGNTSTQLNPSHTYATGGTYTVSLIATGACGADTSSQSVIVSGIPTYPIGVVNTVDTNGVADSSGTYCRITGTVYGVDLRGGNGVQFFMRDNTGGLSVFSSSLNTYVVNQTDSIEAYGTIGQFNGLTQIGVDSINIISTGATLETPDVITSLSEITESDLVEFQCATLVNPAQWTGTGSGFNVDVTNGTDTILVRIDNDVNLYSQSAPTGTFTVRGMGGQFDNSNPFTSGYQLLPRDTNDIVSVSVTAAFTWTTGGINVINFTDASLGATTYAWDFGDGNTSTQQNPSHTYAATGSYTVTLIASNACGADTTSQLVTTSGIPTYPIGVVNTVDTNGVADSSGTYCRITGTVYGVDLRGGNGVQFFMRDNSGGIALFSSSLNTYVVNQTDSIEAYGTIGQFNGLLQLGVDSINIISTGATLETPDVVTSLSEITESDLVEFQCATLINPAQWTGSGSGFNVDVTNGTDTILVRIDADVNLYSQPAPTGTFTVRGMGSQFDNSNPFTSGYQLLPRDTNDIIIVPAPMANFGITSTGGNGFAFSDSSMNANTWAWDFGDGSTSTQQNPNHTYGGPGNYVVTLIVTNACLADTIQKTVVNSNIPYYSIGTVNTIDTNGVADSSGVQCQITGTVYGVDLRGGNGVQFFMRDFSGGIAVFNSSLTTYTVNQTDTIRVYGTIGQFNGLTQMNADSITIISTGATLETPDVITSLSEITESDLVEFQCATLVNPAQWTGTGSGFNVDVTNGTDTILVRIDADVNLYSQPAPTGTFTVRGMGSQFDSSSPFDSGYQLLPRDTNDIVLNPAPVAIFGITNTGTGSYTFSDSSTNAVSWMWDFGDGTMSMAQNPSHTYLSGGTYPVSLIVSNGCVSDTTTDSVSFTIAGFGCNTDIFFSEYIEGSSNNKALEIFNPGDTAVVLDNYRLYRFNNGAATASDSLQPVGILPSGDVWIAGNPSAVAGITTLADTLSTITFFNGDDVILIKNMVTGDTTDIIGIVGVDPGTNWTVGSGATSEHTLVRMPTVNEGTTNWGLSVGQWIVAPRDTLDSLGFHNMNPCGGPVVPTVTFNGAAQTVTEANTTVTVNVSILNHSSTDTTWVEVALNTGASTATNTLDFNYVLDTVMWLPGDSLDKSVSVQIIDDLLVEPDEDIVLNLQNVSPNAIIGGNTYTITITDDDIPYYPIGTINTVDVDGVADSLGLRCKITGTVHGGNLRPSGQQFTLIDFSGGIGVFSFNVTSGYVVNETDSIGIIGTISQFNGLTQINPDSIEFYNTGATLQTPTVVTALSEATESNMTQFNCAWIVDTTQWTGSGSGFNVDITNGTDTIQMRVDADVNLYSQPVPTGIFNVIGIGGQFDSSSPYFDGYQLLPRYDLDIIAQPAVIAAMGCDSLGSNMYNFTDSSTNATSWMWDFGDGNTSTSQNPSHTYAAAGVYTVTLIAMNDCSSDTVTKNIDLLSGREDDLSAALGLYPNPTRGQVNVSLQSLESGNVTITVLNLYGQEVSRRDIRTSGRLNTTLDLSNLSAGVYMVKVSQNGKSGVKKLVLQ